MQRFAAIHLMKSFRTQTKTGILLDRCAVYLQVWNGISAWYPPVGLCFALFLYLGSGAFLPMLAASFWQ